MDSVSRRAKLKRCLNTSIKWISTVGTVQNTFNIYVFKIISFVGVFHNEFEKIL